MPETTVNTILLQSSSSDLLSVFHHLQSQRVAIYHRFESTFNSFLETKDLSEYQKSCLTITDLFASTSKEIREIEAALRRKERKQIADLIDEIQLLEKEKLLMTSKLQVLKTELYIGKQGEDELGENERNIKVADKALMKVTEEIVEKLEELHLESEGLDEDNTSNTNNTENDWN